MSKSPSKIMDEKNFPDNVIDSVTEDIDSYGIEIMKMINDCSSRFLKMEEIFNTAKSYNFGLIPYYIAQQIINKNKEGLTVTEIVEDIISEYIISTVNYRLNNADIYKIKLLIFIIFSTLTNKASLIQSLINYIDTFESLQNIKDVFSITRHDNYKASTLINTVYNNACKFVDCDNQTFIKPLDEVIKKWIKIFNITKDNVNNYKKSLGKEYYNKVVEFINSNSTFDQTINNINNKINKIFNYKFKEFENLELKFPVNSLQQITKIINDIKLLKYDKHANTTYKYLIKNFRIYIYTSFIIYHPYTMKIPSLNDYDDGNGRTAEFLVSKVYEDVINFYIFSHFTDHSKTYNENMNFIDYDLYTKYNLQYNESIWNEWQKSKEIANKNIISNHKDIIVINVHKFLLYLIKHICPATYHPSKYLNNSLENSQSYCHFITNIDWLNIYNIYNIDAKYIIIHTNIQHFTKENIYKTLLIWASGLQIIYKPLKNLWNYYYNVENTKDYNKYSLSESRISDDITVNDYNTGGDLYSIFDNNFMLIDFKKYSNPNKLTYTRTLVQAWMYLNVYIPPLCIMNNEGLYKEYYLAAVNPLLNNFITATYDSVTEFTKELDLSDYKFTV